MVLKQINRILRKTIIFYKVGLVMMIEEKINSFGVKLSDAYSSFASIISVVITGNFAFVSGQISIEQRSNPI